VQKIEKPLFDIEPDSNITFAELIEWFLDLDKIKKKAYYKTLNSNLKHFKDAFGDMLAGSLKPKDLERFQVQMQEADYSDSYIDSILEAAKNVVYKAFDNDLIGGEPLRPFRKVNKLTQRGDNARSRILSHDEYNQIRDGFPSLLAILSPINNPIPDRLGTFCIVQILFAFQPGFFIKPANAFFILFRLFGMTHRTLC
jgi:hypothetical protein